MDKQKVLFAKIEAPSYCSDGIVRAWEENGFEVINFNWQHERFNFGTEGMRNNLLKLARDTKPDLVFLHVQNPEALDLKTIVELQSIAKTVQYTFDVRSRAKTEWMYDYAKYVHYSFFACFEDVKECVSDGVLNVGLLPSSADFELYKKYPIEKSAPDIVFIGNNYINSSLEFDLAQERQEMIAFLKENYGDNFKAYGLGQEGGLVNPQQEAMIYNKCKVAISQNNFDRAGYTSDRLFRAMGCGSLVLTKYFTGIEKMFKKELYLDWWKTFDELKNLIDFYLSDESERKATAATGMLYVNENHTWSNRIKEIMKIL